MTDSNQALSTPQLTPLLNKAFSSLCRTMPPEKISGLVDKVTIHLKELKTALRKK